MPQVKTLASRCGAANHSPNCQPASIIRHLPASDVANFTSNQSQGYSHHSGLVSALGLYAFFVEDPVVPYPHCDSIMLLRGVCDEECHTRPPLFISNFFRS